METAMEDGDCLSQDEESAWKEELDVAQLCRVCANPNDYLIPIFQGEGLEHELELKIAKHLPIKVSVKDKLPTNLCYQCASTLIAWHDMVIGCVEADEKLKALTQDKNEEYSLIEDMNQSNEEDFQADAKRDSICGNDQFKLINNAVTITEEEDINRINSLETEQIAIEEQITSLDPEFVEEVASDIRDVNVIKAEQNCDDEMPENEPIQEDVISEVGFYQHPDIETSIVVSDIVESFEEGQYFAYINDNFIESVEIVNPEVHVTDNMLEEETKAFICEDCGAVFMDIPSFQRHLNSHKNKRYTCNYCNTNYRRIDHLQKHIEIMHPHANIDLLPKEKKINPYAKTFLCNTCGKILKSSIAYENHTLRHQSKCPYPCIICSEAFPNRGARRKHEVRVHNLLTKENGNPDGYHVCEVCGLEMFSDGAYYHHKDKHGDPYPCPFCKKLYGSRSLMQVHARRHTTERPFVCSICNRNFKVKQELNAHMNIHKDLRPYQCPHCPKMCRKSSDLTHHIRTHTGEKPYICDKCGRGFAQAGDMRKHRQLHFRPSKINKNLPSA